MTLKAYMGQKMCSSIHAYFVSYIGTGCQRNAPTNLPPEKDKQYPSNRRVGGPRATLGPHREEKMSYSLC
jgi:hypothetical protein